MDVATLAAAFVSLQASQTQSSIATSVLRSSADSQKAVADLVALTVQDARAANLPQGVGNSIDISA